MFILLRPDRDHHITFGKTVASGHSTEDNKLMKIDNLTLLTNYDINSIMHYPFEADKFRIQSRNEFYNQVGFSQGLDMTATDKISLNMLYNCPSVKMRIFSNYLNEEAERIYIELMQLRINPDEKSQRLLIVSI